MGAHRADAAVLAVAQGRRQPRMEIVEAFQRFYQSLAGQAATGTLQSLDEHACCGDRRDLRLDMIRRQCIPFCEVSVAGASRRRDVRRGCRKGDEEAAVERAWRIERWGGE